MEDMKMKNTVKNLTNKAMKFEVNISGINFYELNANNDFKLKVFYEFNTNKYYMYAAVVDYDLELITKIVNGLTL